MKNLRIIAGAALTLVIVFLTRSAVRAAPEDVVNSLFGESAQTLDIIFLLTMLTLLPSILVMLTGFTRIIIVLSFVRSAMGLQQMPPNQVMIGIALFLTFFVMNPVIAEINESAYAPYSRGEISQTEFAARAMTPVRGFLLRQTFKSDMDFFINIAGDATVSVPDNVPDRILIPAFITSEIKRAFQIGFFIYIPFIVIDMVVASTLMAMGMMMLPPAMISMPFKILLFVMVDGWQLIIGALLNSFG